MAVGTQPGWTGHFSHSRRRARCSARTAVQADHTELVSASARPAQKKENGPTRAMKGGEHGLAHLRAGSLRLRSSVHPLGGRWRHGHLRSGSICRLLVDERGKPESEIGPRV